jgi:hypothetical protein
MNALFNNIEIDVMQSNELADVAELAVKYAIPSIIVHPEISADALLQRIKWQGKFKILTPVDWPKGECYGDTKLRGLTIDSLSCDGFEFLLSGGRSQADCQNEMSVLTDFVRNHISPTVEIRFVLGMHHSDENITDICEAMKFVPSPSCLRTNHQLKLQVSKANPDIHNEMISKIKEIISVPIKVSGNIKDVKSIMLCKDAYKYAVSLAQIKNIIKEVQRQPDQLKEILS